MDPLKDYFENEDRLARMLGIKVLEVEPGRAVTRLVLDDSHRNAVGVTHGGTLFTLADVAFAAASNACGRTALAINASIDFFRPSSRGAITAEARELSRTRRLATYAVEIRDDEGNLLAAFQGTVYRKDEPLLREKNHDEK